MTVNESPTRFGTELVARTRRASAWAFPKPVNLKSRVWTAATAVYAVAVVASAVSEAQWLMDFDPENGAPIPILTAVVTAPCGWIGAAVGAFVSDSLGVSGNAGLGVVWSMMATFGLVQAWAVWRIGMRAA